MTTEQTQTPEQTATTTETTQTATGTETSLLGGQPVETQTNGGQQATTQTATPEPITADSYAVADIEGFNFDEFKAIDENKAFLDRAAEAGITNDQMKFVLGEYSQIIPSVMEQMSQLQTDSCKETLQAEWGAETQANLGLAMKAAQAAGLSPDDINNPTVGNNPAVIKVLAHFGKQLGEDTSLQNTQPSGGEDIQQLMRSEAYGNSKHPDHARVITQVSQWYAKQYQE
ncbi:hypothetical protein [Acinetobacter sp. ANC 4640]